MFTNELVKPKVEILVELVKKNGNTFTGFLFLTPTERVIDMMNDTKMFIAFKHDNGTIEILSKTVIAYVVPYDQKMPERIAGLPDELTKSGAV